MKKQPKIIKLDIEDGFLNGVDAIAFVEQPAIEIDFQYFSKQLEVMHPSSDIQPNLNEDEINSFIFEKIIEDKMEQLARVGLSPDKQPYYKTPEEARLQSPKYGCSMDSWHEYKLDGKTYFMPCGSHDQLFAKEESWIDELTDDIESAVESALMSVGKDEQQLIDEGYDMSSGVIIDAKDEFVASVTEIRNASRKDQVSIADFGNKSVLYRYMNYNKTESINSNSRQFCRNVIAANKWFRKEDINKLTIAGANEGFGLNGQRFYNIFNYKGGKNCKHFWQAQAFDRFIPVSKQKKSQGILDIVSEATSLNPGSLTNVLAESRLGFSKEEMEEQQIVATPIMVPNKLIPRRDEFGEMYYVYFSEDTIKKIAYAFAQSKSTDSINLEHDMDSMVDDVYLAESWLINEPQNDKSNVFGYNLEKGSWFGLFKVNNDEFWNDYIKTGKVKGVSVEGYFVNKLTKLQ